MASILNTYSFSFRYNLDNEFSLDKKFISNFLSNDLINILNNENEAKDNLNNYKELKVFLGKKKA